MWLFVIFDLPMETASQRKSYDTFRKALIADGFDRLQYSVYAQYFSSREVMMTHIERIKKISPREGEVRMLFLTDRQFKDMVVLQGAVSKSPEDPPDLFLFL